MTPQKVSEIAICFTVWTGSVLYSIYRFTVSSHEYFKNYNDEYSDFQPGWQYLLRKKDIADYEWRTVTYLVGRLQLWICILLVLSEVFRHLRLTEVLKLWQIVLSLLFLVTQLGLMPLIVLLIQPCIFALINFCRSHVAIWSCNFSSLLLITVFKYLSGREEYLVLFKLSESQSYAVMLAVFWTNLRCVSYSLDILNKKEKFFILDFFSYCLYLPTLFCGPFISFKDVQASQKSYGHLTQRLVTLFVNIIRFTFWLFFIEFCLHFIYVNAAAFQPEWIETLDSWSLYGYGYTMGQFFHIKYLVIYGFATSIARFEGVKVPTLPVCIGRIHLYSDMWKYFDAGLYQFLLNYIYLPTIGSNLLYNRIFSSFLSFAFVYVWHGTDDYIMIWTCLNFIGVVIENTNRVIYKNVLEGTHIVRRLGPEWVRRITCLAASFLLVMSAISNFYFFARAEVGYVFVVRFFKDDLYSSCLLVVVLYCCCQVSTELRLKRKSVACK